MDMDMDMDMNMVDLRRHAIVLHPFLHIFHRLLVVLSAFGLVVVGSARISPVRQVPERGVAVVVVTERFRDRLRLAVILAQEPPPLFDGAC